MNERHVRAYLERLGYHAEPDMSAKMLSDLILAHLTHIPFENLYIYDALQIPSLDPDDLYEKIITLNGGGVCFELNTLFWDLLVSLGFAAERRAARILWRKDTPGPMSHMSLVAEAEGRRWICDVGFGGPGPKGLLELKEGEQTVNGEDYQLTFKDQGAVLIRRREGDGWADVMEVYDRYIYEKDFELMNFYCARNKDLLFSTHRIIHMMTETGSKELRDYCLKVRDGDKVTVTEARDDQELCAILAREFGLAAPDVTEEMMEAYR